MAAMHFPQRWTRIAGLVLVAIPLSILMLFTFGETAGGDLSGLQHLVQVVPLAVLAFAAWRWPRIGGPLLAGVSLLLGMLFLFAMDGARSTGVAFGTALLLFAPPLIAGLLFWVGERRGTPQGA